MTEKELNVRIKYCREHSTIESNKRELKDLLEIKRLRNGIKRILKRYEYDDYYGVTQMREDLRKLMG